MAAKVARKSLPGGFYSVPVTIRVLVDGRGISPQDRLADAREQAAKWAGTALVEVGEPKELQ